MTLLAVLVTTLLVVVALVAVARAIAGAHFNRALRSYAALEPLVVPVADQPRHRRSA